MSKVKNVSKKLDKTCNRARRKKNVSGTKRKPFQPSLTPKRVVQGFPP
jgi:hypothetical protein